jgi:hypothetical protein
MNEKLWYLKELSSGWQVYCTNTNLTSLTTVYMLPGVYVQTTELTDTERINEYLKASKDK